MASHPSFTVHIRPRPPFTTLDINNADSSQIEFKSLPAGDAQVVGLVVNNRPQTWHCKNSLTSIFSPSETNAQIFGRVVYTPLRSALQAGEAATFFAYGHTGSGKTHTVFGREPDQGIALFAAKQMIDLINQAGKQLILGVGVRMFEMRGSSACDLLNDRAECHIREGYDGKTQIRGQTEKLPDGRIRVRSVRTIACWDWEQIQKTIKSGLESRAVGTSTVHNESSRTHAILEMEIITDQLLLAREAVVEREAELVPVGKLATDIYIEEYQKGLVKADDGSYQPNPDYQVDQQRIDQAEAAKLRYEARVTDAILHVESVLRREGEIVDNHPDIPKLGARLVFVDLAGAEFSDDTSFKVQARQSMADKQASRQINVDLMALKEVIRAQSSRQKRIPYRAAPLTMVLREHFNSPSHLATVIATVSAEQHQSSATLNTLRFASVLGRTGV